MKKVVLFDFFGVIGYELSPVWFRRHFAEEIADSTKHRLVDPGDLGAISEEEMFANIGAETGVDPKQIRREWMEMVTIDKEMVDFIKKVKKSYPVYLLSNALSDFLREILDKNDLWELFDEVFISAEMHLAKPDPEFFRVCLERIGAMADVAVMIDDNAKNLEGAREVGIDTILFKDNESFQAEFKKFYKI
jgi:HAD superfamily hydrolase (TIGR01509 family)